MFGVCAHKFMSTCQSDCKTQIINHLESDWRAGTGEPGPSLNINRQAPLRGKVLHFPYPGLTPVERAAMHVHILDNIPASFHNAATNVS